MKMNNPPLLTDPGKHDCSSINKSWAIVEVKTRNGGLPRKADLQSSRSDIHIGRLRSACANLFKHLPETGLVFSAALSAFRELSRIEHGSVVAKKRSEFIPFKIVEGLDES
jgi:hypothetical protein